jgi:predicted hydrocarbon binding protein
VRGGDQAVKKDSVTPEGLKGDPTVPDVRASFFIVPTDILMSLHDEFSALAGERSASGILYRTGFRCGQTVTAKMNFKLDEESLLGDALVNLWIEIGLGRISSIANVDDTTLRILSEESTEARAVGVVGKRVCDITTGYLAGTASALTGHDFVCEESRCYSDGAEECEYVLRRRN